MTTGNTNKPSADTQPVPTNKEAAESTGQYGASGDNTSISKEDVSANEQNETRYNAGNEGADNPGEQAAR